MHPIFCRHPITTNCLGAIVLVGTLFLGGCGLLPSTLSGPQPDLTLFQEGVESLKTTSSPEAFSRLAAEFPDSPWTEKAKAIEKAIIEARVEHRDVDALKAKLEECRAQKGLLEGNNLRAKLEECQAQKEHLASGIRPQEEIQKKLNDCRVEKERLTNDLRSLEKYTNKLKSLLTEAGIAEPVPPSR